MMRHLPPPERVSDPPAAGTADPMRWYAARLARRIARRHCGPECDWYHAIRPYWRSLGLALSADQHSAFYQREFRALADSGGCRRVLVSGSADWSMPEQVWSAFRARGREVGLTLVDRCRTPLLLGRWQARRLGACLAEVQADVLDHRCDEAFDLICTHSFLTWFAPDRRQALFRRWHALLRPGGVVVTVTRIRPPGSEDPLPRVDAAETEGFVARVRDRASRPGVLLRESVDELERLARFYNDRRWNWPVRSLDRLLDQLAGAGFTARSEPLAPIHSVEEEWHSDVSESGQLEYVGIVAVRDD